MGDAGGDRNRGRTAGKKDKEGTGGSEKGNKMEKRKEKRKMRKREAKVGNGRGR